MRWRCRPRSANSLSGGYYSKYSKPISMRRAGLANRLNVCLPKATSSPTSVQNSGLGHLPLSQRARDAAPSRQHRERVVPRLRCYAAMVSAKCCNAYRSGARAGRVCCVPSYRNGVQSRSATSAKRRRDDLGSTSTAAGDVDAARRPQLAPFQRCLCSPRQAERRSAAPHVLDWPLRPLQNWSLRSHPARF